jgi:hypothetical protein
MRKAKVADKSAKSFDSFFETEMPDENNALSFPNNSNPLTLESAENSTAKTNPFPNLLKQILLFLPGTFLLYFVAFVIATILINIVLFSPPPEPVQIFGITSAPLQIILLGAIGLLGTFMTWFGLGELKNKKHLSIPASIILTGTFIAVVFKAIEGVFGGGFIEEFDKYFVYLLPLILIVPVLTKSWVDKKAE